MIDYALRDAQEYVATILDNRRAAEEVEYQLEDENALWDYNNYHAGIQADDKCRVYVQYDEGVREQEVREDYEEQMAMEDWEIEMYICEAEAKYDEWCYQYSQRPVYY